MRKETSLVDFTTIRQISQTLHKQLRWGGYEAREHRYNLPPTVIESVFQHTVACKKLSSDLLARFPVLTADEKKYLGPILAVHDLDEWEDGDMPMSDQEFLTAEQKQQRMARKQESFRNAMMRFHLPPEAELLYLGFEYRHDDRRVQQIAETVGTTPFPFLFAGLADRLQGFTFYLRHMEGKAEEFLDFSTHPLIEEFQLFRRHIDHHPNSLQHSRLQCFSDLQHHVAHELATLFQEKEYPHARETVLFHLQNGQ